MAPLAGWGRVRTLSLNRAVKELGNHGGESGIVSAANSKITLKMQKSIDPPAIAVI
jgi:hypothetical protein